MLILPSPPRLLTCIFCALPRVTLISCSPPPACFVSFRSLISFSQFPGLSCLLTFFLPFFLSNCCQFGQSINVSDMFWSLTVRFPVDTLDVMTFVAYFSPSKQLVGQYFDLDHDRLLLHHFQYACHLTLKSTQLISSLNKP